MEDDDLRFYHIEEFVSELHYMRWKITELSGLQRSNRLTIEKLRASEEKYRTIVSSLPVRIFAKDRDLVYIYCNEYYASDFNIIPAEVVGKKSHDFFPKELSDKFTADEERVLATGEKEELEERYVVSGQEMICHSLKTPLKDENGDITGILVVMRDVSDEKRMEDENENRNLRLQELVAEKEIEITSLNDRLEKEIKTRKRLEETVRKVRMTFEEEVRGEF